MHRADGFRGFSFILGAKMPHLPYVFEKWRTDHTGQKYADGQVWVGRKPVGTGKKNRADHVTYYQFVHSPALPQLLGESRQPDRADQDTATRRPTRSPRQDRSSRPLRRHHVGRSGDSEMCSTVEVDVDAAYPCVRDPRSRPIHRIDKSHILPNVDGQQV